LQSRKPGTTPQVEVILASRSPRRRQLFAGLGIAFSVVDPDVDETALHGESPSDLALRLGLAKALAVACQHPRALVVGADTLVVLGAEILGKPRDEAEATEMLRRLRAHSHEVYTGLALVCLAQDLRCAQVVATRVTMRDYTDGEIARYVASGDPFDKAGAYAIQHPVLDPVARYEGSYSNVVGLPVEHLRRALVKLGVLQGPAPGLEECGRAIASSGCDWDATAAGAPGAH
jgi:septum formation protein